MHFMSQQSQQIIDTSFKDQLLVINKVEESGVLVLDLSEVISIEPIEELYIEEFLDQNKILREKAFRDKLKSFDWMRYKNKNVCIVPANNIITPYWAYMLLMKYISPVVKRVEIGDHIKMLDCFISEGILKLNIEDYIDKRVVLKGCSAVHINEKAYAKATQKLMPVVRSLMFGEPCSTVPVYKK